MIGKKSRVIGVRISSIENKKFWQNMQTGALIAATWLMFACGGGGDSVVTSDAGGTTTDGGSATVSALSMPNRITISSVDDDDSTVQSFSSGMKTIKLSSDGRVSGYAFNDAGTDYANREKNVWVEDTDALNTVNDILSAVQDSGYEYFVNEGPYKALVKQVGESEQSGGGSTTTSTTTEALMEMTLDVTREDNESPMTIKVWVVEEDGPGDKGMLIRGYFTVTEGVSDEYPYGKMRADFVGIQLDDNGQEAGTPVMNIAMSVDADEDGKVVVQCVQWCGDEGDVYDYESNSQFRLVAEADMSAGKAYVDMEESVYVGGELYEDQSSDYQGYIAYDQEYFKVQVGGASEPTVYDKGELLRKVYRYNLYDADTGAEVEVNGGFPIQFGNEYGYIGYWGMWFNDGVEIEDGDTVTDMNDISYTVFSVGGKLRKHTKAEVSLGDLAGVEMSMWVQTGEDGSGADLIITWDDVSEEFKIIGHRDQENGQVVYEDGGTVDFTENPWAGAWCEALRASMSLGLLYANGADVTNNTPVSYHFEQTVDPSDAAFGDLTLYYYGTVGEDEDPNTYWVNPTVKTIVFNAETMMLSYNGEELVNETTSGWISPLLTTDPGNPWDGYEAEEFYSWSTGPNQWEQFTTLIGSSSGQFVSFDAPLQFTYVHSTANDLNGDSEYNGKTFKLEYDGTDLSMPWTYDEELDEWLPMFSMKDGTELTDSENNSYVVKGIEIGVVMREAADPTAASSLVIDTTIEPPTVEYDSTQTDLVGAKPAAVLEVIKGELINE